MTDGFAGGDGHGVVVVGYVEWLALERRVARLAVPDFADDPKESPCLVSNSH